MAMKPIQFKRSATAGKVPLAADLAVGELALNLADKKIYTKDKTGAIVVLAENIPVPLTIENAVATDAPLTVKSKSYAGTPGTMVASSKGSIDVINTPQSNLGTDFSDPIKRVVQDSVRIEHSTVLTKQQADSLKAVSVYGTPSGKLDNTAYITHAGSVYARESLTVGTQKPLHSGEGVLVDLSATPSNTAVMKISSSIVASDRSAIVIDEGVGTVNAAFIGGNTDRYTVPAGYSGMTSSGGGGYYKSMTNYDLTKPSTPLPATIKKVSTAGFERTLLLLENNELWAAGYDGYGSFGLGSALSSGYRPLQKISSDVSNFFSSIYSTFIIKTNGEVYAAGNNTYGALGFDSGDDSYVTSWTKTTLSDVNRISCGVMSTIVFKNDGTCWVAGMNNGMRLLVNNGGFVLREWRQIERDDVVDGGTAGNTCIYVLRDGTLLCGGDANSQVGNGEEFTTFGTPQISTLPNGERAARVNVTMSYTAVLTESGNLYHSGANTYGQFGNANSTSSSIWIKSGISNVAKIFESAPENSAVQLKNGNVMVAGYNSNGQLGTGSTTSATTWVKFPADQIKDFSLSRIHGLVISAKDPDRTSHNGIDVNAGATVKMVIPSSDNIAGTANGWNAILLHQMANNTPMFRLSGSGKIETADTVMIKGQEVFHPGNMPKIETGNTFDLKEGTKPVVFVRSEAAKDKDNLTFVVEDTVTRITHNNDDASSAFVFTLNNMDSKLTGSNRNTHELIFNGAKGTSSLTLDGNEVYHAGNFVPPDTSNFVHKSYGGYITAPVSMGEDVSAPGVQLGNYQLNINRPLDTAKADSGILRIESKDAVVFTGDQQSLFKIVNTVPALKNAISIYENNYSRSFNVNTQGFCEANEFSAKTRMTVNSEYQGGMVLGLNKSTPGSEWFYIAPRIKDSNGVLSLDTGKMLSYEVKDDTWASNSKFTAYNDLLVGCAHTTRPQASSFANHRVTVRAPQGMNGMLISAEDGSPSALTLMHSKNATTGTLMRILASDTLSPNAGAIATYPKFTNAVQGDPSFQLKMNGDISGTGNINLNNKNAGFVATFTNSKSLSSPGGQGAGIQVTTSDGGTLISGINNANSSGPLEVFSVDSGGTFIAEGGIRTNGMSYFGHENPQGFLTNEGTGSGLVFEMTKDDKDEAKIALGADTLAFKGAPASSPPGQPYGYQTTLLKLNRISGNAEIPEGVLVAKHPIVHNVVGDAGDWWAGTIIKNASIPNTESWKTFGKAGYGIHGSGTTVDSFYVGFGPRPWDGVDTSCAFRVLPDGTVQSKNAVYGALSDERIKTDIHSTAGKLDDLLKVNIVNYRLKAEPDTKMLGVVAQELEKIFPGMVDTDEDGLKSVKYSIFTPMLVKGVQELHALTVEQDKKIEQLNYEVQELKEAIRAIPMLMKEIEDLKRSK